MDNLYDPSRGVNDIRGETITISGKADIEELVNTVEVIIKLLFALTSDANPNKNSSSSIDFKKINILIYLIALMLMFVIN